ncbi:MAG: SMP-30/gluconolactonase/LRE family protein [Rhodospirillales bacterium]
MARSATPDCIVRDRMVLGESPLWSPDQAALYYVDIHGPAIHRFVPATGRRDSWAMPAAIGSIGRAAGGRLVAALADGLHLFDPATGALTSIVDPEPDKPAHRLNDGKVDRAGRFWVGSLCEPDYAAVGALYRVGGDARVARLLDGLRIPNALCWSPDDRTMYFADSRERRLTAFDFDPAAGVPTNRREVAAVPDGLGSPDGATVDADGGIWSAHMFGGRITRYMPDGRIDRVIELPVRPVTSCCFGGADLRTLYITTATVGLDESALAQQPLAGSLFAVDAGVQGLPEPVFGE